MMRVRWLALAVALTAGLSFCGGDPTPAPTVMTPQAPATPPPAPAPVIAPTVDEACVCTPTDPISGDYRHTAKHVDLIGGTPQGITVTDVMAWSHAPSGTFDAPRTGRELQLFHIARAYLQNIYVVKDDCDLHMEISATPDAAAPRMVVETPIDASHCFARSSLHAALKAKGLSMTWGTVNNIPVEVTGMAFDDFDHVRGSKFIGTTWELHPATVTVLP